jgi:phospholipase C
VKLTGHRALLLLIAACELTALGSLALPVSTLQSQVRSPADVPIDHVIVIFLENRSFDHLYGLFPGADGLANAGDAAIQIGDDGNPYEMLPPVLDSRTGVYVVDPRFPDLPNAPFNIGQHVSPTEATGDLVHRFYQQQLQINNGAMNRFVAVTDAGALTMGYYDGSALPLWQYARQYVLADRFFQAAFGGSMLNHFWLVCACTPIFPDAPDNIRVSLGPSGEILRDGAVTPDGFVVNNLQSVFQPHDPLMPAQFLVPPQTAPHIGDRLDEKGLSWAWYSGGWANALQGRAGPLYSFVVEPFMYFANLADGTDAKAVHLRDELDFLSDVAAGRLPNVAFVKPQGGDDEHPASGSILQGDLHAAMLIQAIQASPVWGRTAVIVTYDENGGFWDHVAPPPGDRWGPGARVPALIISPWAKRGFVDHTVYDTTSILRFIEWRWGLEPLGGRDAAANNLNAAFNFSQPPTPAPTPSPIVVRTPRPVPTVRPSSPPGPRPTVPRPFPTTLPRR